MLSNFDQRLDISSLTTYQIIRFAFVALLLSTVTAFSGKLMAETAEPSGVPANPVTQLILLWVIQPIGQVLRYRFCSRKL